MKIYVKYGIVMSLKIDKSKISGRISMNILKERKNKIFIKEIRPEMTQCRMIQVEKNIKKKRKK